MKNLDAIAEEELRTDTQLLRDLRKSGIINSQYDLSRLCGMNQSYFSSMKSKGIGLSIGSLAFLQVKLATLSCDSSDPRAEAVFRHAAELVSAAVTRRCELLHLRRFGEVLKGRRRHHAHNRTHG